MEESLKVFISCVPEDQATAYQLHEVLSSQKGLDPWLDELDLRPGDPVSLSEARLAASHAVIFLLSENAWSDRMLDYRLRATLDAAPAEALKIPALEDEVTLPAGLDSFHPLRLYAEGSEQRLIQALEHHREQMRAVAPASPIGPRELYLSHIRLHNIRCFEELELEVGHGPSWTMILGDNATGKSTLLRSIALGLCNETDTVALMKDVPGTFLRQGADEGAIHLVLRDTRSDDPLEITTTLERDPDRPDEVVRKQTLPEKDFPWSSLFVCGYGTHRSGQAHAGHARYSVGAALATLFDDAATLQNPELVLLRQSPEYRKSMERRLLEVLMLDPSKDDLAYLESGAALRGPWGEQPFAALSDGYRSTSQWVLDFMSWAIQAGRLNGSSASGGVLILDEIEQHLHPSWQRYIVQRLRRQFPKTQIIASSHTPLVAAGAAELESCRIYRLNQNTEGSLEALNIPPGELLGRRADQILASDAFGLPTSRAPESIDRISRYAELKGKMSRTAEEQAELDKLQLELEEALRLGETDYEQKARVVVEVALKKLTADEDPELVDLATRRQLVEIFGSEDD